jgi:hypothetical protein
MEITSQVPKRLELILIECAARSDPTTGYRTGSSGVLGVISRCACDRPTNSLFNHSRSRCPDWAQVNQSILFETSGWTWADALSVRQTTPDQTVQKRVVGSADHDQCGRLLGKESNSCLAPFLVFISNRYNPFACLCQHIECIASFRHCVCCQSSSPTGLSIFCMSSVNYDS